METETKYKLLREMAEAPEKINQGTRIKGYKHPHTKTRNKPNGQKCTYTCASV